MTSTPEGSADAADTAAPVSDVVSPAKSAVAKLRPKPRRGSLFEQVKNPEGEHRYGKPGPPFSRNSPFYRGFWATIGVLLAVGVVLAFEQAGSALTMVVVAAFLAVGLNPIVEVLLKRGWRRGWAVLFVALLVLGVISLVVFVLVGLLRNQILSLIDDAPHLLNDLKKHKSIAHLDAKYHIISNLEAKIESPDFAQKTFGGIFNVSLSVFKAIGQTVVVFVLTLYFLAALPQLKRGLYSLTPASRRERVAQLGDEILRRVGGYVIGAFLVALLAGTVSAVFLLVVGLGEYALPLAVMVAVLDLVPLVGSLLGASIVCIVGLANSLPIGIACIAFYLVYETLEGYVIYPRVMRSSVDVPEYVTIVAVLLGGSIDGVLGALLALPIAAAGLLLVREIWVRRQNVT